MKTRMIAAGLISTAAVGAGLVGLGSGPATAADSMPACGNADLVASYTYSDAGAGHTYGWIVLKNVSGHSCHTGGFGGISYVGHGDGTQIGAAAAREGRSYRLVVKPGTKIRSLVDEVDAGAYSTKKCKPTHVDGFRVYVPNATVSQYVAHPTTGCANDAVELLSHRSYRHA
ncbi:MAG: DUF4232 domain-containing protein [Nocardioides sp.]|uniref:DUF4232 domain-containing protein n=1 Tax=Nocardioides sp. TaxID=35761 RepID=UPI0039E2B8AF